MSEGAAKRGLSQLEISNQVLDAAYKVHSRLGPGLLESAYQACLAYEIRHRGFRIEEQAPLRVIYEEVKLDLGYRLDIVVEDRVIVELKTVEKLHPLHRAQLLSYLKMSGMTLGLLLNFNVEHLKDGIRRVVIGQDWKWETPS